MGPDEALSVGCALTGAFSELDFLTKLTLLVWVAGAPMLVDAAATAATAAE